MLPIFTFAQKTLGLHSNGAIASSAGAGVDAATGACFSQFDPTECRQKRLELIPNPYCQVFTGGIFQTGNIVEVVVVQLFVYGLEHHLELGEIHQPAGMGLGVSSEVERDAKTVAMQAGTFVALGDVGQAMGCLKGKLFKYFHGVSRAGALIKLVREGRTIGLCLPAGEGAYGNQPFLACTAAPQLA